MCSSSSRVGLTRSYDRTPPCSLVSVITQCSQYFHSVDITGLQPDTTYFYHIPGGNGTADSNTRTFKTAKAAGAEGAFTVLAINDMGYTFAKGTHQYLAAAVEQDAAAFAWHGGDISYADDWYSGILACELTGPDSWPICSNGTSTILPGREYRAW